ncbi:type IX secretion system motor protein PorM/GldM [Salegentibacter mishustinae]|uniref:Gliding motility protein GldM n=1 Tax=Salegentibacter mishustinae TaxID=270918 RepID=A0A0Q9ZHG1_9FLAO|nr:gliding motility protein GldM [Salegentibacter mishustinae]KRG27624.1 gliding motility protein GldM [Salegentibacter mishustinae]PNW20317.1 gliding motility protein GldM [Salegentibacter mishustinae]PZX63101.1 gliding motility-associated protein GldM [Salegentibacter mishustinae]GGW91806.1 gliding motility protein GldM [Salegentibacter mishustinae]
MASGKQTPRQKMINLMYLVFIAMMALNMSKEVLTAFGQMNEDLEESNATTSQRNDMAMAGLAAKAEEQPAKYEELKAKAEQISTLSDNLYTTVGNLKDELLADFEGEEKTNYESMDRADKLDNLFFASGRVTPRGEEFVAAIDNYRNEVLAVLGDRFPQIRSKVANDFSTEEVTNNENVTKPWLMYNYQGFPLIASLTKLTQIQSDIRTTENDILSAMLEGQLQSDVSLTNYQAIVVPEKTAFFSGENFKGKVVLGRVDPTLKFENVTINGNNVESTQAGQVMLDFPAGNVGEKEINGELQFKEGDSIVRIPINSSYAVIPKPNSAVISADKMNVLYRGVQNPMTISIPGVGSISAQAPGLSPAGGAGQYVMNVTSLQAREVAINVSGKLPGGETVSDSKTFRIKDIPTPVGTVRGEDGTVKMQRNSLEISTISANLPDFDFNLDLNVSGFSFKVMGQPTIRVNGNKLDSSAKAALRRAGRGETVQIFDIQAGIAGNSSYKLKKVSPVIVELTN